LNVPAPRLADDALALLMSYQWPGNIREMQNVIERAVLLSDGKTIAADQLPREVAGAGLSAPEVAQADSTLQNYEKAMVIRALKESNWNQTQAAKALGISRDNLRYRIKKYEIERE
jgi:transcriptional regulator of acetoin/glycerol metabolism